MILINILTFFWLIRVGKSLLFWVYLWQLKEYHVGRFLDHFRTSKGKELFFNFLFFTKIIIAGFFVLGSFFSQIAFFALLFLYFTEAVPFLFNLFFGKFKKPKLTSKTLLLMVVSFALAVFYLNFISSAFSDQNKFAVAVLLFDIFIPLIISFIVLFFQPLFVAARIGILKKARKKRERCKNLIVVGVVGSYGKTTTKEFLKTILSAKFNVLATLEHQNSEMGIANTILNKLNDKHEVFIVEMGAYKKGGIFLLCDIARPKIGVVTGVNEQHLATFGSMGNLLSAEGGLELAGRLPKDGVIILNGDNKYCLNLYKKFSGNKKLYSVGGDKIEADIKTESATVEKESVHFIVKDSQNNMAGFRVQVLGKHNIENLLAAILVAKELGMTLEEIALSCQNIKQEQAGIVLRRGIHGINIIDSSYSSNPDGVFADLEYLAVFEGKRVLVMPCLIELGSKSAQIHYQIGKKVAEVCDLAIITTKDKLEDIKSGAAGGAAPPEN